MANAGHPKVNCRLTGSASWEPGTVIGVPLTLTATAGGFPSRIQAGPVTEKCTPASSVPSYTIWPSGLLALTSSQQGPLALTTIDAEAELS